MMYANTCKYLHCVSSNMDKYANYMLQICNHMQVIGAYMYTTYAVLLYAPPHMQLYAFDMNTHACMCILCMYT